MSLIPQNWKPHSPRSKFVPVGRTSSYWGPIQDPDLLPTGAARHRMSFWCAPQPALRPSSAQPFPIPCAARVQHKWLGVGWSPSFPMPEMLL